MQLYAPDYVVLIVEDVDRSLAFYVNLLGLYPGHRAGPWAQLATGRSRLGLYERSALSSVLGEKLEAPVSNAPGFQLGFKVEDVDAAYADLLNAGVEGVSEPSDRPWGQRGAHVRDPDGHLIELVEEAAS